MWKKWLPFEWIVAIRFLRQGRLQTLFIIAGVAIGVGVIVFMSAILACLQANFIGRVLSAQAHIQLLARPAVSRPQSHLAIESQPEHLSSAATGTPAPSPASAGHTPNLAIAQAPPVLQESIIQPPTQRTQTIDQWQTIMLELHTIPEIKIVAPVAAGSVLAIRGQSSRAITLVGIVPELHEQIIHLGEKIRRGNARLSGTDVLVGIDFAADLGVDIGDKIRLVNARGGSLLARIAGVFDLGQRGANKQTVFASLKMAQSLLAIPGSVTSLEVTVGDVYAAEDIAQSIARLTGVEANSWIKSSAQFFTAISAQTIANTAIRFFVGLSVALGIASVLVVTVVQRSHEIGILRAMGITQGQILRVFLLQGGLLGLGGSMVGCLIGVGGLILWHSWMLNPDGTAMTPLILGPPLFITTFALASLTGLVSAVAPALRAARLDPVAAIRA